MEPSCACAWSSWAWCTCQIGPASYLAITVFRPGLLWQAIFGHLWPPLATKPILGRSIFFSTMCWRVLGRPLITGWCSWDMDGYGSISRPLWGTSSSCASCRHLRQGSGWGCNKWAIWKVPITNCTFNARVNVVLKMYARVQLHVCDVYAGCVYIYMHTPRVGNSMRSLQSTGQAVS